MEKPVQTEPNHTEPERVLYWEGKLRSDARALSSEQFIAQCAEKLASFEAQRDRDPLTGLLNLSSVKQRLAEEIELSKRELKEGKTIAVLMLDLDGFKKVNDDLGHEVGNQLIRTTADFLRAGLRKYDIAGRYGGDEFIVVCRNASIGKVETIGERLREGLAKVIDESNYPTAVTTSVGISCLRADNEDPDTIIKEADDALRTAKATGKNKVETYAQAA